MANATTNNLLRWLGYLVCVGWLAYSIDVEFLNLDPNQFGFKAPDVEAEMKNCTATDMKSRYECKEQAILAGQRQKFVDTMGSWAICFGPPILAYALLRLRNRPKGRARGAAAYAMREPSIKKWRVKWPASRAS